MLTNVVAIAALVAASCAQETTVSDTSTASSSVVSGADYATGSRLTYQSYTATISLQQSNALTYISSSATSATSQPLDETVTANGTTRATTSVTQTLLTGGGRNSTGGAATATSSSVRPTNTRPCNGHAEFCQRSYGNITQICAHNSPFHIRGSILSNQALGVTTQLNDGIRMLQFQVHKQNSSSPLELCHTSCNLLNAGTLVDYLTTVREWLDDNPYEVITILMGNYDVIAPGNFTGPVADSGIDRYLYTPPTVPMPLDQWPTLGNMILRQTRVVMMLDYEADQTAIPWLLDEFANAWETPFSPTNRDFPCTVDRPPNQDRNISANRLSIANHNLNVDVQIAGFSILIPASTLLNETNGVEGYGSAGVASTNCTADWNRPPNFILVDYYNIGSFNGSVFQVAANANGVTYNRDSCCGTIRAANFAASVRIDLTMVVAVGCVVGYLLR